MDFKKKKHKGRSSKMAQQEKVLRRPTTWFDPQDSHGDKLSLVSTCMPYASACVHIYTVNTVIFILILFSTYSLYILLTAPFPVTTSNKPFPNNYNFYYIEGKSHKDIPQIADYINHLVTSGLSGNSILSASQTKCD